MSIFESYVIVSTRVLEGNEVPTLAYKEAPEAEDDSGWTILSGNETDKELDDQDSFLIEEMSKVLQLHPSLKSVVSSNEQEAYYVFENKQWSKVDQ